MRTLTAGLCFLLLVSAASAGNIRMELSAEVTPGDHTTVVVTASNTGDEPAQSVLVEGLFGNENRSSDTIERLEPGARHAWTLEFPPLPGEGTYPLPVGLRYTDGNGYPFSALLVHLVRSPGAAISPVHAQLELEPVAGFGAGTMQLENPLPRKLTGRVVFLLPNELTAEPVSQQIDLPAQGRLDVPLTLRNTGALLGSFYPATALFEYELDGTHFTVASTTMLEVRFQDENRYLGWGILVGAGVAFLALIGVAFWFSASRARPAAAPPSR